MNYPKHEINQLLSKAAYHLAGIGMAVAAIVMIVQILEVLLTVAAIGAACAFFGWIMAKTA